MFAAVIIVGGYHIVRNEAAAACVRFIFAVPVSHVPVVLYVGTFFFFFKRFSMCCDFVRCVSQHIHIHDMYVSSVFCVRMFFFLWRVCCLMFLRSFLYSHVSTVIFAQSCFYGMRVKSNVFLLLWGRSIRLQRWMV